MYEHYSDRPLSRTRFLRRMGFSFLMSSLLLVGSLALGMVGYRVFEGLSWIDGFLNSAMLLGGMGPVDPPHTVGGKVFAGAYALFAGLGFLLTAAILFTPVLHRILHKFHWKEGH